MREALTALRSLPHESSATVLGTEGLVSAVEELIMITPVQVDLQAKIVADLPSEVQLAAYLAILAALDNVATHAGTDHASIMLREKDNQLTVRITDDGRGGAIIGRGLTEVADRIGALDGSLDLASRPGQGTSVTVRLPCVS